jgi:hypothetical protein
MHKRIPVADIGIDDITNGVFEVQTIYNQNHLPLGVIKDHGKADIRFLNTWWTGRWIPASRTGLKGALEILGLIVPRNYYPKDLD